MRRKEGVWIRIGSENSTQLWVYSARQAGYPFEEKWDIILEELEFESALIDLLRKLPPKIAKAVEPLRNLPFEKVKRITETLKRKVPRNVLQNIVKRFRVSLSQALIILTALLMANPALAREWKIDVGSLLPQINERQEMREAVQRFARGVEKGWEKVVEEIKSPKETKKARVIRLTTAVHWLGPGKVSYRHSDILYPVINYYPETEDDKNWRPIVYYIDEGGHLRSFRLETDNRSNLLPETVTKLKKAIECTRFTKEGEEKIEIVLKKVLGNGYSESIKRKVIEAMLVSLKKSIIEPFEKGYLGRHTVDIVGQTEQHSWILKESVLKEMADAAAEVVGEKPTLKSFVEELKEAFYQLMVYEVGGFGIY